MPIWGQSGWEVLGRGIAIALDKLGVKVQIDPKLRWNLERCKLDFEEESRLERMVRNIVSPQSTKLQILHQHPPSEGFFDSHWYKAPGKKVCISLFETDKCPLPWKEKFKRIDEVWVFSEFNRKYWEADGVKNVRVMPFGIDTKLFNPDVPPLKIKGRRKFMFITNGDYTERKWFEGLIEAYVTEFKKDEDVCLLFKTHYGGFVRRYKEGVKEKIRQSALRFNSDPPPILFVGDKVAWYKMPSFYIAGDCFVLPSRGEGLGLPYAEALACEVPVIATGWGGQTEFLNKDNAYFIDYDLGLIDDLEYLKKCVLALNHKWATPHLESLKKLMRFVYTFPEEAKKKAKVGRKEMEKLTWRKVGLWVLKHCFESKEVGV